MVANLTLNPVITTNAAGTFSVTLDGMMQGMAMDDPAMRNQLAGGYLDSAETLPMFGGIPITESLPPSVGAPVSALGNNIKRATASNNLTGISVYNQVHSAINTPQSPAPQILSGGFVAFYRFGSLARIPMACDPALLPNLPGLIVTPIALYWDPVNFFVTATAGAIQLPAGAKIIGYNAGNSMTVSYNPATGFSTWNRAGNTVLLQI
jgi:hypothetical protein